MVTFDEHFCLIISSNEGYPADSTKMNRKSENSGSFTGIGVIPVVATLWPFLGIYMLFAGLIVMAVTAVVLSILSRTQNNGDP